MKRLGEIKVGKRLWEDEMKQIRGNLGMDLTGTRCNAGQCYCDFYITDGGYSKCDVPCDSTVCASMGITC